MKHLKFILTILILSQCFTGFAQITQGTQDPNNAPYVGTWEYQNGNEVFRLFLEEDTQPGSLNRYSIIGHYEMVEVDATGQETLIYTSRPQPIPARHGAFRGVVHYPNNTQLLSGAFREYHVIGMLGSFKITTVPADCPSCPEKIRWELKRMPGPIFHIEGDPVPSYTFEVPTDIVLEKVN